MKTDRTSADFLCLCDFPFTSQSTEGGVQLVGVAVDALHRPFGVGIRSIHFACQHIHVLQGSHDITLTVYFLAMSRIKQ